MLLKAIGLLLLSSVKFAVATLPIALAFPYKEALGISILGGLLGVFFFLYIWRYILALWQKYWYNPNLHKVKTFKITKQKRKLINIKNQYGYWGIIILTPLILSIPIGVFLLVRYFKPYPYKELHLSLSISIWGLIFISFFEFLW